MESLNKARKAKDINQTEIAKTLADLKSVQKYVRNLAMAGVKMSTFGILRMQGEGGDADVSAQRVVAGERDSPIQDSRGYGRGESVLRSRGEAG